MEAARQRPHFWEARTKTTSELFGSADKASSDWGSRIEVDPLLKQISDPKYAILLYSVGGDLKQARANELKWLKAKYAVRRTALDAGLLYVTRGRVSMDLIEKAVALSQPQSTDEFMASLLDFSDQNQAQRFLSRGRMDDKILHATKESNAAAGGKEPAAREVAGLPRRANQHIEGKMPLAGTRRTGVNRAAALEVELVKKAGKGTFDWTADEIAFIKRQGQLPPRAVVGHHINNVAEYPEWAGDPRNIKFVRDQDVNLAEHGGAFQNPTQGPLIDRQEMIIAAGGSK